LAIVSGIIVAIVAGATILAVTSPQTNSSPTIDTEGNSAGNEPKQITVELSENLSVEAK
jgi:hypothetical protein